MKKYLLTIFLVSVSSVLFAQWTTNNGKTTTNDKIGIGTTSPGASLDVQNGDIRTGGSVTLGNNNGATPNYKLYLAGGDPNHYIYSTGSTGNNTYFGEYVYPGNSGFHWVNSSGGNELMTINGNGYLGIGISSPLARLNVNGGVIFEGNGANLDPFLFSPTFMPNSARTLIGWNRTGGRGETDFIQNQGGGDTGGFAYYNINNSGSQSLLMFVRGNGQVTIGDVNPYSYKLAVGGSMIAESLTIKAIPNWPDYVFKKNYNLIPLAELKAYLDKNQHLPEIPSASEQEKEGLDLGKMNQLLLKKVEELTLYLIEKDKEINELKQSNAEIKHLKNEFDVLKDQLKSQK